jgi:hypothetical protein
VRSSCGTLEKRGVSSGKAFLPSHLRLRPKQRNSNSRSLPVLASSQITFPSLRHHLPSLHPPPFSIVFPPWLPSLYLARHPPQALGPPNLALHPDRRRSSSCRPRLPSAICLARALGGGRGRGGGTDRDGFVGGRHCERRGRGQGLAHQGGRPGSGHQGGGGRRGKFLTHQEEEPRSS